MKGTNYVKKQTYGSDKFYHFSTKDKKQDRT